jgi:hypothetical protein
MALVDPAGNPLASTSLTDEQMVALMAEEVRAVTATRGPAILALAPIDLFHLVGLVQLAGRHPELESVPAEAVAGFVEAAREYFADCPTVLEVIRRGEDPQFDA